MKMLEELGISPAPWAQGDCCGNDDMVYSANRLMVAEELRETDARLIAAAPDLYEACRRAIVWEDHVIRKKMKPPENWKVIVAAMRAALEKAGGAE